jgi:hypothetical protein
MENNLKLVNKFNQLEIEKQINKGIIMVHIDKYWDQFEPIAIHWHYMAMALYGLLCLIGFPANMAVIVYYLKNVKKRKSYNYLIVNLMTSDIVMLLTAPIVTFVCLFLVLAISLI